MEAGKFEATLREAGGGPVIDMRGDINGASDAALGQAYAAAAKRDGKSLLLNFKDVGYINSTGIAVIVKLLAQARKDGRTIAASGLTDHYREIFEITRLADFMKLYPDEQSALAAGA